jgi:hypothetical protein
MIRSKDRKIEEFKSDRQIRVKIKNDKTRNKKPLCDKNQFVITKPDNNEYSQSSNDRQFDSTKNKIKQIMQALLLRLPQSSNINITKMKNFPVNKVSRVIIKTNNY